MRESIVERLLYMALALLLVLTGISSYFLALQLRNTNATQKAIKSIVDQIKANQDTGDKKILDHIDCIGFFLSQPNRAEVRIEDLQNCKITSPGAVVPLALPTPATSQSSNSDTKKQATSNDTQPPPQPPPQPPSHSVSNFFHRLLKMVGI